MFKVDIFIHGASLFGAEQMRRRRREMLDPTTGETAFFASPEDVILAKLDWYKQSGQSERQWHDVLGIIKAQGSRLDLAHLRRWADHLGIGDELEKAIAAGGLRQDSDD